MSVRIAAFQWKRKGMETPFALLTLRAGILPFNGIFLSQKGHLKEHLQFSLVFFRRQAII